MQQYQHENIIKSKPRKGWEHKFYSERQWRKLNGYMCFIDEKNRKVLPVIEALGLSLS